MKNIPYKILIIFFLVATFTIPAFAGEKSKVNANEITQKDLKELEYWKKQYPIDWYKKMFYDGFERENCNGPSSFATIRCHPVRILSTLSHEKIKSLYLHYDDIHDRAYTHMIVTLLREGTAYMTSYSWAHDGLGMNKITDWIKKGIILKDYREVYKNYIEEDLKFLGINELYGKKLY